MQLRYKFQKFIIKIKSFCDQFSFFKKICFLFLNCLSSHINQKSLTITKLTIFKIKMQAVSDFYIPFNEMSEHKIQSSREPLVLTLKPVPKMLKPLVSDWCPNAFVISFKVNALSISYLF